MKTKHPRDIAANANNDVVTLPSSIRAVLYHGTVLVHKDWAKELLQMGFGSLSCIGVGGPVCDREGEIGDHSLILHDEEALYLCKVGIVAVRCSGGEIMDSAYLLKFFTEKRSTFPLFYKTYDYFKSRGFVVRPGMNFGMDYSIYRLNPTKCHSEICVQVIDARKSGKDIDPLLSWRNISTLTRVMPDVMKMCILCFVYNEDSSSTSSAESPSFNYLSLLDSQEEASSSSAATVISLDDLVVKPVSFVIRRLSVNVEKYLNVSQIQSKYRSSSKLYMPRTTVRSTKVQSLKVNKKRRDHLEVRTKNAKATTVWKVLDQEVIVGGDEGKQEEDCMDEDL